MIDVEKRIKSLRIAERCGNMVKTKSDSFQSVFKLTSSLC